MMINHSVHIFWVWLFVTYGIDTEVLHSGTVPKPKLCYRAIPSINISLIKGRIGILTFMYVANPDITTWLQSRGVRYDDFWLWIFAISPTPISKPSISLFTSVLWDARCCKPNNQSSGCRPKCCYNQSDFFKSFSWSIITVTADYLIAVAHP